MQAKLNRLWRGVHCPFLFFFFITSEPRVEWTIQMLQDCGFLQSVQAASPWLLIGLLGVHALRFGPIYEVAGISQVGKHGPFRFIVRSNRGGNIGQDTRRAIDS